MITRGGRVRLMACSGVAGLVLGMTAVHAAAPPALPCSACAVEFCPVRPVPPTPLIIPPPLCDGGDHAAPARPLGRDGIGNLTAGDTVARYRVARSSGREDSAEADGGAACESLLTASNCACVFAPRFGAVRQVLYLHEETAPLAAGGLALETPAVAGTALQPVRGNAQWLAPQAARRAMLGVGLEERTGPLAVDQTDQPEAALAPLSAAERRGDMHLAQTRERLRPSVAVGFDVPVAWTCVAAANVLVGEVTPQVVSVERGTAVLRVEHEGRAELTLCKQAGSDSARIGEELDFTIFMLNSGEVPLADIVLVDALPDRLQYINGSAACSLPADFSPQKGDDGSLVLSWRLQDTLPAGGSGFVRFRTVVH